MAVEQAGAFDRAVFSEWPGDRSGGIVRDHRGFIVLGHAKKMAMEDIVKAVLASLGRN